ncbi:redoxin domain-containing protein [Granulicoccus phenolivorans]|uniref:redoxin domain-containing protein n=1 Tax=Granulicoccus phenolivorans TaxID=266854 RepID=UPI0003FF27FE|nr:redoxin domain-containing protein [Granulicoccus phenolivorans]
MTHPEIGERIEPFDATNQLGQTVRLPGDSWWLLVFYPYAFTGIGSGELRVLKALRPQFDALGCRIAAISCDSPFALRVFADSEGFWWSMISDHWPHGKIAKRFGVFDEKLGIAQRASFLFDPQSRLRWLAAYDPSRPRDLQAHLDALRRLRAE